MKSLALLAALGLVTGCSDDEPETETAPPEPSALTGPLELRRHVLDQLDEQEKQALERKRLVDEGFDNR